MEPFTAAALGIASIGLQIYGMSRQNKASKEMAAYEAMKNRMNQRIAEFQYNDALKRGDEQARNLKKEVTSLIGSQKVGYAVQNVEIESGSALEVQAETAFQGELDIITIKQNAIREAYGYKIDALNGTMQSVANISAIRNQNRNNILTTSVSVLDTARRSGLFPKGES